MRCLVVVYRFFSAFNPFKEYLEGAVKRHADILFQQPNKDLSNIRLISALGLQVSINHDAIKRFSTQFTTQKAEMHYKALREKQLYITVTAIPSAIV